jgi:hypothetical protein
MSISKPDEGNMVLILCTADFDFLFNVLEIVSYFHDILIVLAVGTGSAKTGVTKSAQFPNAVSYERGYCECIASDFQLCKIPLNCAVKKKKK